MTAEDEDRDIRGARRRLDDALVALSTLADPAIRVRDVERELAAALVHTYRAIGASGDSNAFYEQKSQAVARARRALELLQERPTTAVLVERLSQGVAAALRTLHAAQLAPSDEHVELPGPRKRASAVPPMLRASKRVPQLLSPERSTIFPVVPLQVDPDEANEGSEEIGAATPPAVAESATSDELDAKLTELMATLGAMEGAAEQEEQLEDDEEPSPPPPLGPPDDEALEREYVGTQRTEQDVVFDRARACFEDLAMLSLMRRPAEGQTWTGRDKPERRLLARVDAIVACGWWVFPRLVKQLEQRPLPDPDMTWAAIFLFGSLAGDDALDQAVRVARTASLGLPEMRFAVADAMALAPHPGFDPIARSWLTHSDEDRRAVAVSVLRRRRTISLDEAVAAAHDPAAIVAEAGARALASPVGLLREADLARVLGHSEPEVVGAAMASATVRRHAAGVRRARELTEAGSGAVGDAALLLAVAGDATGRDSLVAAAQSPEVDPLVVEALGWCGSVAAIELLLVHLESEKLRGHALAALQRITDASLTEDDPDPEYGDGQLPFVRFFTPPSTVVKLHEDPAAWRTWWDKHRAKADARARFRFGHRWSALDSVWELASPLSGRRERWSSYLELVARTGDSMPFDPDAFVAHQEEQVREWRTMVEAMDPRLGADPWATRFAR